MLDPAVRELLEGANFIHLGTLMADGAPHNSVLWATTRGDHAVFFTNADNSLKQRNVRRDPRVSISVIDRDNPYRSGWLRGRVAGTITGEEADEIVDDISRKYVGAPFPMRGNTVYLVEVERSRAVELPFEDKPAA